MANRSGSALSFAESVIRELHAEPRQFSSPRAALLWYRDALARKLRVNRDPAAVGTPMSRASIEQADATFAAVANCLRGVDNAAWLVCWYETRWGDGIWLSEKAGLSRWAFTRRCRKTERVVRERMRDAGLLREEER